MGEIRDGGDSRDGKGEFVFGNHGDSDLKCVVNVREEVERIESGRGRSSGTRNACKEDLEDIIAFERRLIDVANTR